MAVRNTKIVGIMIFFVKEGGGFTTLFLSRDAHKAELAIRWIWDCYLQIGRGLNHSNALYV